MSNLNPNFEEFSVPITPGRGRKEKRTWRKTESKSNRYKKAGKTPRIACKQHNDKRCRASTFREIDVVAFFDQMYNNNSKTEQDKFICKHIEQVSKSSCKSTRSSLKHFISLEGSKVPVCSATFCSILNISRTRVQLIAKSFRETGTFLKERRGGARLIEKNVSLTDSIQEFISTFKCRESHYGRSKSIRGYLPPELSLSKMWRMWKARQLAANRPIASRSKFSKLFHKRFNLSFSNPRQDVCSYCEERKMKIRSVTGRTEKQSCIADYMIHKVRARKFYEMVKSVPLDTVSVSFDMQKNQPLPKLSVGEVYYSRQVWLYNLTFVRHGWSQDRDNVFTYTWLETQSGKGSNEVASALDHFLTHLENEYREAPVHPHNLRLYSDSCPGQNKNTTVMGLLMRRAQKSDIFSSISHVLPVRGHSYLPPDRVFGRVEKVYKKKENIVSPQEYFDILGQFGNVFVLGQDWYLYDFMTVSKDILKSKMPFLISEQKVFTYQKDHPSKILIRNAYTCYDTEVCILKRGKSLSAYETVSALPLTNRVKKAKAEDVRKLLTYFKIPDNAVLFYDKVQEATMDGEDEGDVVEYDSTEPFH